MGPSADTPAWKPLGELLVEQGWLSPADLEDALEEQERSGLKLGQIVVDAGFISVEELTTVLLTQCGIDISTQEGFGSGLRDELARRGRRHDREPVRFKFDAEPEPGKPPKARRARRVGLRRNRNRKPLKRLEKLVQDFERQELELAETIAALRRTLATNEPSL